MLQFNILRSDDESQLPFPSKGITGPDLRKAEKGPKNRTLEERAA
jgi:hypothetical protein